MKPILIFLALFCAIFLASCIKWPGYKGGNNHSVDDDASDNDIGDDEFDDDMDDTDNDAADDDTDDDDDNKPLECDLEVCSDPNSGLMWQVEPTGGPMMWSFGDDDTSGDNTAISHCPDISLGGYSDWRLPTISELRSLIRGCDDTETSGFCFVTDECLEEACRNDLCNGCSNGGGPAGGCYWPSQMQGACNWYWSSSAVFAYDYLAWVVDFYNGYVDYNIYYSFYFVRCVR